MNFDDFEEDYCDLASDISGAGYNTFEQKLSNLFALLDGDTFVREQLVELENSIDFESWYKEGLSTRSGMVGSGKLAWADDHTHRLAQHLALFRHFASNEGAYIQFCSAFLYAGSGYDEMVWKINSELFDPFERDLLKYIRRKVANTQSGEGTEAQDEIFTLDHSTEEYHAALSSLTKAISAIKQNNKIGADEPLAKERVVAELEAGESLLHTTQVRIQAVWDLIKNGLHWVASKATEIVMTELLKASLIAVAALLAIQYVPTF